MNDTLIYNIKNQALIDEKLFFFIGFFILLGLFSHFILSKLKPKESAAMRLFGVSRHELEKHGKLMSKMLTIISILLIIVTLTFNLKNYFYINKIEKFEDIKSVNGKVMNLNETHFQGEFYYLFDIDSLSFKISRDSRYISFRNLLHGDSLKVDYYEIENKKTKYPFEVTKIELLNL